MIKPCIECKNDFEFKTHNQKYCSQQCCRVATNKRIMEKYYAFIKNNRVMQVAVFVSQNEALADAVAQEQGFDDAIWTGETVPAMWSTYDGTTFTLPTDEYLISIGILQPLPEVTE
jgi:hypothetical protein